MHTHTHTHTHTRCIVYHCHPHLFSFHCTINNTILISVILSFYCPTTKKELTTTLYADTRSKISFSLTHTLIHTHTHTVPFWTPPSAALCSLINILISRKDEGLILINKGHMQHGEMRREQIIFPDTSYIIRLTLSNVFFTMQNAALTAITLTHTLPDAALHNISQKASQRWFLTNTAIRDGELWRI